MDCGGRCRVRACTHAVDELFCRRQDTIRVRASTHPTILARFDHERSLRRKRAIKALIRVGPPKLPHPTRGEAKNRPPFEPTARQKRPYYI